MKLLDGLRRLLRGQAPELPPRESVAQPPPEDPAAKAERDMRTDALNKHEDERDIQRPGSDDHLIH